MSCNSTPPTFRLLDSFVGWDEGTDARDHQNLTGLEPDDPDGLRLAQVSPNEVDPAIILAYIPPPRLARGCRPCDWYLITPAPPASRLLRMDACSGDWQPVWKSYCAPDMLICPVAVAAWRRRVAVADRGANMVWVWARGGEQLVASISVTRPGPIAFTPHGELLVTFKTDGAWRIARFGPAGERRGEMSKLPDGEVERIAVSSKGAVWLVLEHDDVLELWQAARGSQNFKRASIKDLQAAFHGTNLTAASEIGFCLERRGPDNLPVTCCYTWYGRAVETAQIVASQPPRRQTMGQLLTQAIDSGIPRCRWHRVEVEADVPPGTTLAIAVATEEISDPVKQGEQKAQGEWKDFPAGVPHTSDWFSSPGNSPDFLIQQPPGRYLFVRLRLTGDGSATPVVRRIRLVFPRSTSLEMLPPVYRERPEAEDFTERFLSLFDTTIADLDRAVERYPALLDSSGVPDEVLPWLGSFLDVTFDQSWSSEQRRRILGAVPELYRQRGTVAGLKQAINLIFGAEPAIQELASERSWGALGRETELRAVRLYGKARARFRLGSSALNAAPIRSYGNPDDDPLIAAAYRFRVLMPPLARGARAWRERLERLVASQKPAHTVASVRVGGAGFVVGNWSSVGVDTVFAPLPPPILGKDGGNVRLGRMSVLWSGAHGPRQGLTLGRTAAVGIQTVME